MQRSYHADERVFQKLRAAGKSSWDEQADPEATFDRFVMRPFLEASLAGLGGVEGLSALEIGCGSGPIACYLASRGMAVRGIDLSPTALDMARRHAAERGLSVQFDAADICLLPEESQRYNLIVDGHCLHCIVWDDQRRSALDAIRRLLKPDGLLLIETMISHADLVVAGNYRIDERGVLSIRTDDPADVDGAFESEGAWFAPYRRLLAAKQMLAELGEAGFAVRFHAACAQSDPRKPMLLQVRAVHRSI